MLAAVAAAEVAAEKFVEEPPSLRQEHLDAFALDTQGEASVTEIR